jgi:hypothetical protein
MDAVGAAAEQLGNELDKLGVNTLTEAKAAIDDKLKHFPSSILVIIDDLDRLPVDQIRQMFRLIKAVANFSKIIYLASFDKEIVMKALDPEQTSEEGYMAKIVQIAFELPIPDRNALRKMLEIKLQAVLKGKLLDQREWNLAYGESSTDPAGTGIGTDPAGNGISHFIKTPRDVMRLANYLSLTYPAVESEVNVIDFIIIETFRVFSPGVYDFVRRNQRYFCVQQFEGTRRGTLLPSRRNLSDGTPSTINAEVKEFHENAFKTLLDRALIKEEDKKPIQRLLVLMFPIFASIYLTEGDASHFTLDEQSRKRGIKDQDRFPYYFRLSPPAGGISQAELTSIMNDNGAFRAHLEEFAKSRERGRWDQLTKSESALAEISKNIVETTVVNNAKGMLMTAFEFFGRGEKAWILESLVLNLLAKCPADFRFNVVRESIETTNRFEASISLLRSLENAQGEGAPHDSDGQPLVSGKRLKELQTIIASKIEGAAKESNLVGPVRGLLACWNVWGDRDSLKKWISAQINQPATRGPFLLGFLESPYRGAAEKTLHWGWLMNFVEGLEPKGLVALAKELDVEGEQKQAVDALVKTYEDGDKEQEKNPFGIWSGFGIIEDPYGL